MKGFLPRTGSASDRLRRQYLSALLLIGLLTIGGHALMQVSLHEGSQGTTINIAGRQRMLSQRIAKIGLELAQAESKAADGAFDAEAFAAILADETDRLSDAVALFERSHQGLQRGDPELGLAALTNAEVAAMFDDLRPRFELIVEQSKELIRLSTSLQSIASEADGVVIARAAAEAERLSWAIAEASEEFLPRMNAIVFKMDAVAGARDRSLAKIDLVVLAATLATLALEGMFIFGPAVRMMRRHVESVEQAKEHAERAERAKSDFLANMSHEIRTPMTAIVGFAEVLSEPELDAQQRAEHLATIRRSGTHLLELIDDILDLSKIESAKLTIEQAPMSPADVVSDVYSLCSVRAGEQKIQLDAVFDTPIPRTMIGDAPRVRQILINLIGNAIKFTKEGRVTVRASLIQADGPILRIAVEDTGIGIPEEKLQRIFEAFSQADASTTRKFGGTGLGLTISRSLADAMGAELNVESEVGVGSTFELLIPVSAEESKDLIVAERGAGSMRAEIERPQLREEVELTGHILLVDDSIDNRRLLSHFLKQAGAEVSMAENGQEAVEMWGRLREEGRAVEMIYLDMQMPVLDGYGAACVLREQGCDAPIVALTAHALEGDREKCLRAGCDDYLTKPVKRAALIANAAAHMRRGPIHRAA